MQLNSISTLRFSQFSLQNKKKNSNNDFRRKYAIFVSSLLDCNLRLSEIRVLYDVYCFVIVKPFLDTVLAEGLVCAVQLHVINTHLGKDLC